MAYSDRNSDPYRGDVSLDERLTRLEQKIDRLFALLFAHLRISKPLTEQDEKELQDLLKKLLGHQTREESERERQHAQHPGVRVFNVEVDDHGEFQFQPERWRYPTGSRVQWVSKTGSFTVSVDPQYTSSLGTPFEGRAQIRSRSDDESGIWKTDVIEVKPLFSPTELMARRLAGAPHSSNRFTVAVSKGDKVFIDQSQVGFEC